MLNRFTEKLLAWFNIYKVHVGIYYSRLYVKNIPMRGIFRNAISELYCYLGYGDCAVEETTPSLFISDIIATPFNTIRIDNTGVEKVQVQVQFPGDEIWSDLGDPFFITSNSSQEYNAGGSGVTFAVATIYRVIAVDPITDIPTGVVSNTSSVAQGKIEIISITGDDNMPNEIVVKHSLTALTFQIDELIDEIWEPKLLPLNAPSNSGITTFTPLPLFTFLTGSTYRLRTSYFAGPNQIQSEPFTV